jgi:very-short-patch-repair endonuclease
MHFTEKQSLCHKRKISLLKRQTPSELKFTEMLKEFNIRFMSQKGFIAGNNFCIVDFYLPDYKTCIEIDGGYHYESSQITRDLNRDYYLNKQRNFGVLHIDNNSIEKIDKNNLMLILFELKSKRSICKL